MSAGAPFGFALAGGYAVQAHGFLNRPSADVDIFASSREECDFPAAVDAVLAAFHQDGLAAVANPRNDSFARIAVTTPEGEATKLEMGVDWRAHEPQLLSIGPVLHPDDAVANKISALFGRAENRDYIDVGAIIASGRYTKEELLALAEAHDPGFDRLWFAEALADISGRPDRVFLPYGLDAEQVTALKKHMTDWAARLKDTVPMDGPQA